MNQRKRNKTIFFIGLVMLIITTSIYLFRENNNQPPSNFPSDFSTSTSPIGWGVYENKDLGVSFKYPTDNNSYDGLGGVSSGTTGKTFQATIKLPSGSMIRAYATTKDFSEEKGGFGVGSEGFILKGDKYYLIRQGRPTDISFSPDEVLILDNGLNAPILYGKNYDPSLDYPDPAVKAMINTPTSKMFTGIGFVLWNMDNNGSHPASPADLLIFKDIIMSINFLR